MGINIDVFQFTADHQRYGVKNFAKSFLRDAGLVFPKIVIVGVDDGLLFSFAFYQALLNVGRGEKA